MHLSELEKDVLGDLTQDAHELWEIYAFVHSSHPDLKEDEVIRRGRELIAAWVDRGWLQATRSRTNNDTLSGNELLTTVDELGPQVVDPQKGKILLRLTDLATNDVDWLPPHKR
jgi:hypothetical protein